MNIFYGLCVSKGNIKGKALIVDSSQQPKNIKSDKTILVMKTLDRSLLINLSKSVVGVIAEVGNIGSHGAGILRQLKIPCILRIQNATKKIKNGENIEICGDKHCIIQTNSSLNEIFETENTNWGELYKKIAKPEFDITDIHIINDWTCSRPDRPYQRMRFDIIKDVYVSGATFLFGLPKGKVKQNSFGAISVYGAPCIADICSFVIAHPEWLLSQSKNRTIEILQIKTELSQLNSLIKSDTISDILYVFERSIKLYQQLFKYAQMSQAISDEILDIYLDFVSYIYNEQNATDIINLKSIYVENCINSGIDPGVSQRWNSDMAIPHIWDGLIDFTPLDNDNDLLWKINHEFSNDKDQLTKDYRSFQIIVPLVYQLAEEFFYVSSSINSFINWSIVTLCKKINGNDYSMAEIHSIYETPLEDFINQVKNLNLYKKG